MNETTVTIVGNLVDEPRMRTTESGVEVTNFRIASSSRRFDRETARWVDGGSLYLSVTCWRSLGVNVAASIGKGDPVIVHGRLFTRQYERDGQVRSAYELDAVAVGPDLARGTATFERVGREGVPATYSATDERGMPETPAGSGVTEEHAPGDHGAGGGHDRAGGAHVGGGVADPPGRAAYPAPAVLAAVP
jgi:single-strand DNA-binding protein